MALVEWKNTYSVNISEIDNQHKKLIGLINEFHDAMIISKGREILSKILKELIDYTEYHFATEEKYFDQYGYPESEIHKGQHRKLIKKANELQMKHESGEYVITLDVMNFLRDWLQDHILGSDKLYSNYLNSKGII